MKVKIGDICTLKSGTSLKEDILNESNGVPYIKVSDMNLVGNEKYIVRANSYVDESISEKMLFPKGTVLFPKRGGAIGTNKKRIASKTVCADLNTMGVIPSDKIRPLYLYYYFQNIDFGTLYNGSSVPQINNTDIAPMEINLIPLEEQDDIVALLEKTDEIARKRKEELQLLDDLIKARFVELFGDRYVNDKNWNTAKLGESISFNNGKAHEQVVDENGEYILVTSRAIASDFEDVRRTNTLLFPLHKNDIVMVMSDVPNGKALAKCQLIDSNDKYTLNQRICSFDNYEYNPIFLMHLLNRHPYFLSFNDGNGQTNLRKNDILECELIIPPMELQEQFADFVHQVDKSKF